MGTPRPRCKGRFLSKNICSIWVGLAGATRVHGSTRAGVVLPGLTGRGLSVTLSYKWGAKGLATFRFKGCSHFKGPITDEIFRERCINREQRLVMFLEEFDNQSHRPSWSDGLEEVESWIV
jgi:hypothetical protein